MSSSGRYLAYFLLLLFGCGGPTVTDCPEPVVPTPPGTGLFASQPKIILDTDTANEIDDLFAIARLLAEDSVDLLGICSAQWFHHYSGDSSVYQSQRLNEELIALSDRPDLPLPLGADSIMGDPWGGYAPRPSPASRFIIEQARALPEGEKLVVLSIGAATNLASALSLDTSLVNKIVAYTLGFRYDFDGKFWNKDEFNIRRDLNAANYLLNLEGLELHVMPVNVAVKYTWPRADVFARLDRRGTMGAYLKRRWQNFAPDNDTWVMWDVALLQAFLDPSLTNEVAVLTPPENTRRGVWMYTDLNYERMYADFWATFGENQ